jgi:hypothetical protein
MRRVLAMVALCPVVLALGCSGDEQRVGPAARVSNIEALGDETATGPPRETSQGRPTWRKGR